MHSFASRGPILLGVLRGGQQHLGCCPSAQYCELLAAYQRLSGHCRQVQCNIPNYPSTPAHAYPEGLSRARPLVDLHLDTQLGWQHELFKQHTLSSLGMTCCNGKFRLKSQEARFQYMHTFTDISRLLPCIAAFCAGGDLKKLHELSFCFRAGHLHHACSIQKDANRIAIIRSSNLKDLKPV